MSLSAYIAYEILARALILILAFTFLPFVRVVRRRLQNERDVLRPWIGENVRKGVKSQFAPVVVSIDKSPMMSGNEFTYTPRF